MSRVQIAVWISVLLLACGDSGGSKKSEPDAGGAHDAGATGRDAGGRDGAVSDAGSRDGDAATDASTGDASVCAGNVTVPQDRCRSEADCTHGGEVCRLEGDALCGICKPATRDCDPKAPMACGVGGVCIEYTETCACDGPSSMCVTDCRTVNPATPCANQSERCDQATGRCIADCQSGAVQCPTHASCAPGAEAADANGCVRKPCVCDADCGTGVCARGRCYDELGECTPPIE